MKFSFPPIPEFTVDVDNSTQASAEYAKYLANQEVKAVSVRGAKFTFHVSEFLKRKAQA